nr:MAG TPA: hypothetical protein [Caudoviricetes sp.]
MKHTDHTLCWHCKHAVPTKDKITGEYLTGCAWSIDRLCWRTIRPLTGR